VTTPARRVLATACIVAILPMISRGAQPAPPAVVHVWKIGSPHRGDAPVATIPSSLDAEAHRLGFELQMRVFRARDFASAFFSARVTNDEPDILVIDNMGHINGITTPLGSFDGIASDPNVAGVLVKVSESLNEFQPTPWEYLIRTSKHHAQARALATRKIDCRSTWPDAVGSAVLKTAEQAVVAYFLDDKSTYTGLVNGDPADTAIHLPHEPRSITDIHVCDGWGTDRLAFMQVVAAFEGQDEIGYRTFLAAVASSVGGEPRALMLGGSTTIIPTLRRDAAPFSTDTTGSVVQPPIVDTPEDGATASRMPPETRPMMSWIARGAAFCLIEWQFGQGTGEKWEGSGFAFVRNGPETSRDGAAVTMRAPFGVGRQPHRWRVWAISDRGDVARSPWRTLFYAN
jgi:hypothetical protein